MAHPHISFLSPGDLIYITCPAGFVAHERVAFAAETLAAWGFRVELGKTIGTGAHYMSGHDAERLADLQHALDRPDVAAILMGRGGYGCSRIVDDMDWAGFRARPKWICGFSDITVLHSHLQAQVGYPSLHSPMCGAFRPDSVGSPYIQSLLRALTGETLEYRTPPHPLNRAGAGDATLTGGNLAILAHLTGSPSEADTRGKLLFIEDVGEYRYNIDRMLLNLRRAGKLDALAGLVVGSFTDTQDTDRPFGQEVEDIIADKVRDFDYPVLFGLPCGHAEENVTLRLGARHRMEVSGEGGLLKTL